MFVELLPLLKQRRLLITAVGIDDKVKVNVIPTRLKEGEDEALRTPLSYTATPEELDAELGRHLASYAECHLALGSTLAEAKGEMEAAAKAARHKAKRAHPPTNSEPATAKKEETAQPAAGTSEITPSLFAAQPAPEPAMQSALGGMQVARTDDKRGVEDNRGSAAPCQD